MFPFIYRFGIEKDERDYTIMRDQYTIPNENIQHNINTRLRMFINRLNANFPTHWHTDIEIIWPKETPCKIICADQTYFVGVDDILLICPTVLHEIYSIAPGTKVYLQADFSGINSLPELDKAFHLLSPALHIKKKSCPTEIYDYLSNCIEMIMNLYIGSAPSLNLNEKTISFTELAPYDELEIYSILMQFIACCGKNIGLFRNIDSTVDINSCKNDISLGNVCSYITEHFTEDISLENIANYAGFSKYHFERIFSEYTGVTFYQYLLQLRISYAKTLLSNPALTITDISFQSGFASCAAFTRAFKRITGFPPSKFRILNEEKHPLGANPHFASLQYES